MIKIKYYLFKKEKSIINVVEFLPDRDKELLYFEC